MNIHEGKGERTPEPHYDCYIQICVIIRCVKDCFVFRINMVVNKDLYFIINF